MNNAEHNLLGKKVAYSMANYNYSEIIWIIIISLSVSFLFWILFSYSKNQNKTKEYLIYSTILMVITFGRLPHFSRGFIDGDESIWITNALTLINDPGFYFSEIVNTTRFFSVAPLLLLYPIGINHTTCQLMVIIIFFLTILILCKILALRFDKKNIFISIVPFVLLLSLLNTYGFIPYNSEHFSILIIFLIIYTVEKVAINGEKKIKSSLLIIGILSFIAFNCKIQSVLILTVINLYLFFKIKIKLNIFYVIVGFFLSYLPFIISAFYANNLHSVYAFWFDNIYYAIFGLNDHYKDNFINEVATIFSVPDTKYFYLFSFLFLSIATTIIFKNRLYQYEYIFYAILTVTSLYTVIAPQFLFLHYFFYFIFIYFLFFCYLVNIYLKYNSNIFNKSFYLLLCCIVPSTHILYSGNISFKLSSEKLAYYNSQNFLLSLRDKYLKDVSVAKFSILGWNNKYYTDGNFILGSSEMYTTLFELDFPSRKYRYERFIFNLEKRLPEIFCIQNGKSLRDYHELSLILNNNYTWIANESGDDFYILNSFIDNNI